MSIPKKYSVHPASKYLYVLYNSLASTMYSITSYDLQENTIQEYITTFLNIENKTNYEKMYESINFWLSSTTIPQSALGIVSNGTPAINQISGLRVMIILSDGKVAYDTTSINNNYENINKPKSDFLTNGKYLINENHGVRSYFQSAINSDDGTFFMRKYSYSSNSNLLYLCFRQGKTRYDPLGVVVIAINSSLENEIINTSDTLENKRQI